MLDHVRPPDKFMLLDNNNYPSHQSTMMIEPRAANYFFENRGNIDTELVYVPIQWTAYHRAHHYGQYIADLQYYIEGLIEHNPTNNFFTIVQYADGILAKFPKCKIFAAGGWWVPGHPPPRWEDVEIEHEIVPIPLLCDPHPILPLENPKYVASFAGNFNPPGKGGPIRKKMAQELTGLQDYFISGGLGSTEAFRSLIGDSIFVLCPRGYGVTSYRMYEVIQMQRIPVYISDDMFLPFKEEVNWNRLAICISPDQIGDLPAIISESISSGEYLDKIAYGKEVWEKYFTWSGCLKTIERIVVNDYPTNMAEEK